MLPDANTVRELTSLVRSFPRNHDLNNRLTNVIAYRYLLDRYPTESRYVAKLEEATDNLLRSLEGAQFTTMREAAQQVLAPKLAMHAAAGHSR